MPSLKEFMESPEEFNPPEEDIRSQRQSVLPPGTGGRLSEQLLGVSEVLHNIYDNFKHNHSGDCFCTVYHHSHMEGKCLCQLYTEVILAAEMLREGRVMPSLDEFMAGNTELENTQEKILAPMSEKVLNLAKKLEELRKQFELSHNGICVCNEISKHDIRKKTNFCLCNLVDMVDRHSQDLARLEEKENK